MAKLVLADKSARDPQNLAPTSERLINLYAVPAPTGATSSVILRSVPGTRSHVTLPGPFLRAMTSVEGVLYMVVRGALFRIRGGTMEYLAAVDDDPVTTMAGHRDKLTISAGGNYYLFYDGITQPGSGRIVSVGSVAFADQFTLMSERGGREIEWTEVGQPDTRNALNFATAEGADDKIVRIATVGAYVVVFKERTSELWSLQGTDFLRVPGGVYDTGLLGPNLVAQMPGSLFFVGHDRVPYMTQGGGAMPVSMPAVNQALQDSTPTHCFYYEDRGHRFCVLRFSDRPAWVYDAAMGLWHERSSGVEHGPWDIIASAFVYGEWYMGGESGGIYRLGRSPTDANGPMRRTVVSRPLYMDGRQFSVPMLEVVGRFGNYTLDETAPDWLLDANGFPILNSAGQPIITAGNEPSTRSRPSRMFIATSRDGGHSFGRYRIKDIGRAGDFDARCKMHGLGQFRHFTAEVNMTDPVDVPLLGEANIEVA